MDPDALGAAPLAAAAAAARRTMAAVQVALPTSICAVFWAGVRAVAALRMMSAICCCAVALQLLVELMVTAILTLCQLLSETAKLVSGLRHREASNTSCHHHAAVCLRFGVLVTP